MCCCKIHLHARWSITALIECSKKKKINIYFDSYESFFQHIWKDCEKSSTAYINWKCCIDKNTICTDIEANWTALKEYLMKNSNENISVNLMHFENEAITTKNGNVVNRLKAKLSDANMIFIIDFISDLLMKIIYHRNQLKHNRSSIHDLRNSFNDALYIDMRLLKKSQRSSTI